jgi:hypothetical protein
MNAVTPDEAAGKPLPVPAISPLAERVLAILERDPKEWSRAHCTLLLTLYPLSARKAMAHVFWQLWSVHDLSNAPEVGRPELLIRLYLVAGLQWKEIVNPVVKRSWWASFKLGRFAAGVRHDMERLHKEGKS